MPKIFSIRFSGNALENKTISPYSFARSLLALDNLIRLTTGVLHDPSNKVEMSVKAGNTSGLYFVELVTALESPEPLTNVASSILDLIRIGRFAWGKKVSIEATAREDGQVPIFNQWNEVRYCTPAVARLYNRNRTQSLLSGLTQTLDSDGVDLIQLACEHFNLQETLTKEDRRYFRHRDGPVLTDNEAEVLLEVIGPMTNGSPKGWKFSEGDDGIDFTADIEDEDFLEAVKAREVKFENGTALRAVVRTVQRKNIRTVTDRTIVEVRELIPPSENLF